MAISSMIVQPAAASLERVTAELRNINGVAVHCITRRRDIIILVEAASSEVLGEIARTIEAIPGVLGLFPPYQASDDEDLPARPLLH